MLSDWRSTERCGTQRLTAHLQGAEWWLAGWKSIVGRKTPSKLSVELTSCYCRQHLFHKADVSPGQMKDAGGSSLISIRAMNYKSPIAWSLMGTVWSKTGPWLWLSSVSGCSMLEDTCQIRDCLLFKLWCIFVPPFLGLLSVLFLSFLSFLQAWVRGEITFNINKSLGIL